jgi:hypothetical protein
MQEPAAVEVPPLVEIPSPVEQPPLSSQVESEPVSESPVEEQPVEQEQPVEEEQPVEQEQPVEEEEEEGILAAEESVAVAAPAAVEHSEPSVGSPPDDSVQSDFVPSGSDASAAPAARSTTQEPVVLQQRPLSLPVEDQRVSWLAPAIRRLAEQRDAKLAAELVIELLPAQRQVVDGALGYEIKIDELGTFYVTLEPTRGTVSREGSTATVDFSLEGSAAALSELAGGGASRRQPGLRIRKGRRRARRLLKARRRPLALADLANAGIDMWPGLLLLAMAEAIDPSWTAGRRFELAFEILDSSGVVIYVRICDGEPILVSRTATGKPVATVSITEHGLMCLLGGIPAPPEDEVLLRGDATSVEMFLQWTARAQGLS